MVPRPIRTILEQIYERNTYYIASDAGGLTAYTKAVSPAGLLLAGRLAGYQALRDQIRIDRVQLVLKPIAATTSAGLGVLYIERDPAAAVVATPQLALDQFEVASAQSWAGCNLIWTPQQPSDKAYQNLNPGTTVLANFFLIGSGHPVSTPIWNLCVKTWATLRGRP